MRHSITTTSIPATYLTPSTNAPPPNPPSWPFAPRLWSPRRPPLTHTCRPPDPRMPTSSPAHVTYPPPARLYNLARSDTRPSVRLGILLTLRFTQHCQAPRFTFCVSSVPPTLYCVSSPSPYTQVSKQCDAGFMRQVLSTFRVPLGRSPSPPQPSCALRRGPRCT